MDLNKLKYFYSVAKFGSFSRASKEIHISQPSLSKMVKLLEEDLGEALLIRSKQGTKLTVAGQLVFEKCQNIFNEAESIRRGLLEVNEELSGELNIGASDNLCNYLLPHIFNETLKLHSKVKIGLFSGTSREILRELDDDKIELGIFYTDVKHIKNCEVVPLKFVEFYAVSKNEIKFRELSHTPFVGSRQADYKTAYPALAMLNELGVKPTIQFETNNQETQKRMVLSGDYFTIIPSHMVEAELRSGLLQKTLLPKKIGAWISIVKKRNKPLSKQANHFIRFLEGQFKT